MAGLPTAHSRRLGEIDTLGQGVLSLLEITHRAAPGDRDRLRQALRERLTDYVALAMAAADQAGA